MMYKKTNSAGFTLIELLIGVAIIGILTAIAYPSYTWVFEKSRRQEAQRTLLEAAQEMESYYAMNLDYSGALTGTTITDFSFNDDFSDNYSLSAVAATSSFTLSAIPIGAQASDDCGTLTLSHTGNTAADASGCW